MVKFPNSAGWVYVTSRKASDLIPDPNFSIHSGGLAYRSPVGSFCSHDGALISRNSGVHLIALRAVTEKNSRGKIVGRSLKKNNRAPEVDNFTTKDAKDTK